MSVSYDHFHQQLQWRELRDKCNSSTNKNDHITIYQIQVTFTTIKLKKKYSLQGYTGRRGLLGKNEIHEILENQEKEFWKRIRILNMKGTSLTAEVLSEVLWLSEDKGLSIGKVINTPLSHIWQQIE